MAEFFGAGGQSEWEHKGREVKDGEYEYGECAAALEWGQAVVVVLNGEDG